MRYIFTSICLIASLMTVMAAEVYLPVSRDNKLVKFIDKYTKIDPTGYEFIYTHFRINENDNILFGCYYSFNSIIYIKHNSSLHYKVIDTVPERYYYIESKYLLSDNFIDFINQGYDGMPFCKISMKYVTGMF